MGDHYTCRLTKEGEGCDPEGCSGGQTVLYRDHLKVDNDEDEQGDQTPWVSEVGETTMYDVTRRCCLMVADRRGRVGRMHNRC